MTDYDEIAGALRREADDMAADYPATARFLHEQAAKVDGLAANLTGALKVASECAMYDGDHHKMWVIDQMVRHLTGCPTEQRAAIDAVGTPYTYEALGESEAYRAFVGDDEDDWDEGIAP